MLNELVHEKKSDCLLLVVLVVLVVFRNLETRILNELTAKFLSREGLVLTGQPGYWSRVASVPVACGTRRVWLVRKSNRNSNSNSHNNPDIYKMNRSVLGSSRHWRKCACPMWIVGWGL